MNKFSVFILSLLVFVMGYISIALVQELSHVNEDVYNMVISFNNRPMLK